MNFDEWKEKNLARGESKSWIEWCEESYQAGQQSQQAKIGILQIKINGADERAAAVLNHKNKMIDELQARIDEITNHVGINFDEERDDDQHSYWSGYNQAMRELNDILKGNKDEN